MTLLEEVAPLKPHRSHAAALGAAYFPLHLTMTAKDHILMEVAAVSTFKVMEYHLILPR
jgi:hypothetical protein